MDVASADGAATRVLVIDDDRATVELYRAVLADEGYRVTTTASPDLEPAAVATLAPALLLLDLRFDGHAGRGVELIARLKADPATRTLPLLVCSADTLLLAELAAQLRVWDCGVLAKPFNLDDLLATVQACLGATPAPVRSDEVAAAVRRDPR
jgi:CheY-like chemotaxis protein